MATKKKATAPKSKKTATRPAKSSAKAASSTAAKKATAGKKTATKATGKADATKKRTAKPAAGKKTAAKASVKKTASKTAPKSKAAPKATAKKKTAAKTTTAKPAAKEKVTKKASVTKKKTTPKKTAEKSTPKPKAAAPATKKAAPATAATNKNSSAKSFVYKPNPSLLDTPQTAYTPGRRYSDADLQEFKELIQEKLEAARKEVTYLQGLITRKGESGTDDTESKFMGVEDGSGTMEREQLSQLASRQIQYIDHLEKALMRIENKTYGICRVTGKLIDKKRLRAVPHATLSIEAKQSRK